MAIIETFILLYHTAQLVEQGEKVALEIKATKYRIDKQQGPTVWHKELYSLSCSGEGVAQW